MEALKHVKANITQQAMNQELLEEQRQQTALLRVEIGCLTAAFLYHSPSKFLLILILPVYVGFIVDLWLR